ncbi:TPA: exo-alpha-sialidase [Streptococcus suis]|nr:exo-alpha-sialidase [Streptococcus suis]
MLKKNLGIKPVAKVALYSSMVLASFTVSQQLSLAESAPLSEVGGNQTTVSSSLEGGSNQVEASSSTTNQDRSASEVASSSSVSEQDGAQATAAEVTGEILASPSDTGLEELTLEVDPSELPNSLVGAELVKDEVLRLENIQLNNSNKRHELTETEEAVVRDTASGTIYLEYSGQAAKGQNHYNLFSLSSSNKINEYTSVYVNNGIVGIEARLQSNKGPERVVKLNSGSYRANNNEWNAVAVTYNKNEDDSLAVSLYINGELVGEATASQDLFGSDLDKGQLGETQRATQNAWAATSLSINNFTLYNRALAAEEIAKRSALFVRREYPFILEEGSQITDKLTVYEGGRSGQKNPDNEVASFRIPALLKTDKGTLIAATDQRHDHHYDWGNIAQVVKRSTDQGVTWGPTIKLVDLRANPNAADYKYGSPLTIDTALVQDPSTKRIFAIYDMYPEGKALFGAPDTYEAEYTVVDGKHYLNLYKAGETSPYLLKEDGRIYAPTGEVTDYRVNIQDSSPAYANIGDIYQGSGTEAIGNIYFQTQKTAPFRTALANFIWMSYSDDDGVTWSHPKDITPNLKKPHMKFLGLGPGTGIVLWTGEHAGRLVVPAYSLSYEGGMNSQSALVFYSDDHGETWFAGKSFNDGRRLADGTVIESATMNNLSEIGTEATIVQLNNGQIKMFMRGKKGAVRMATSTDGGASWQNDLEIFRDVPDVYVQLSAIHLERDGKEYVVLANANGPERTNGHVRIAEVQADGSLVWLHHQMVQDGEFAYNSIQHLGGDDFGLLYEHKTGNQNWYSLYYRKFNWNYLTQETSGRPQSHVSSVDFYKDNYIVLNFENDVLALNEPNLHLSNGHLAEFVSQLDNKKLLYRITEEDLGSAILEVASGSLLNINKLPVSVVALLSKDKDQVLSKIDGKQVQITGQDVYEDGRGLGLENLMDGNKARATDLRWDRTNNPAITLPQTITLGLENEKVLHSLLISKRTPGNGTLTKYQVKAYLGDQQVFDTGEQSVAFATAEVPVFFNGVRANRIEFIPLEAHSNSKLKNNTMLTIRELQLFELLPAPLGHYTESVELKDAASNVRVQLEAGESKSIVGLRVLPQVLEAARIPEILAGKDYDLYDISLLDKTGQAVAPTRPSLVIVPIDEGKEVEKVLYFVDDQSIRELEFTETQASDAAGQSFKAAVFVASSFSHYALVYKGQEGQVEEVSSSTAGTTTTVQLTENTASTSQEVSSVGSLVEHSSDSQLVEAKGSGVKAELLPSISLEDWLKEAEAAHTAKGASVTAEGLSAFDIEAWLQESGQSGTEADWVTAKGESVKADALPAFDIEGWLAEQKQASTALVKPVASGLEQASVNANSRSEQAQASLPKTASSRGDSLSALGLLSLVGLASASVNRRKKQ